MVVPNLGVVPADQLYKYFVCPRTHVQIGAGIPDFYGGVRFVASVPSDIRLLSAAVALCGCFPFR